MGSRRYRLALVAVGLAAVSLATTGAAGPADPAIDAETDVLRQSGVHLDLDCHLDVDCSTPGDVSVEPCRTRDELACAGLGWACVRSRGDDGRDVHVCTPPGLSCREAMPVDADCPTVDVEAGGSGPVSVDCSVTVGDVDCEGDVGDEDGPGPELVVRRAGPSRRPVDASTSRGMRSTAVPGLDGTVATGSLPKSGQGAPVGGPVDGNIWTATAAAVAVGAGLVVLYRRLTRDDVLGNDLRERILEEVADSPGIHARELSRRLDVSPNTVIYHARVLAEHDLLQSRRAGRRVAYFRPGDDDRRDQAVQAALASDAKRRVVEAVLERPSSTLTDVADRLDRHRSTVKYHVDALVEDGVLEARQDGRCRRLSLAERASAVLDG